MNILNNAVEAIQTGLEDFKTDDYRRAHSALRNIFAGMLLLFKEKLRRMSPPGSEELLIKQYIVPSLDAQGQLIFKGKGRKTVDVQQIKERFAELKINVNWKIFDEISDLRNFVEHYYTDKSPSVVIEVVAKSFKLIRDFCVEHLNEEPADLFGANSWNIFLETNDVYEDEKIASRKSLAEVDWTFATLQDAIQDIRCPSCDSDLIHAVGTKKYSPSVALPLLCKKCQEEFDLDDLIEALLTEHLAGEAHMTYMDGGDSPYTYCPECLESTYVYAEECCLKCGYEQEEKSCAVCGTDLDLEEAHLGDLCSYHRWVSDKTED